MTQVEKDTVMNSFDAAMNEVEIVSKCLTDSLCWLADQHNSRGPEDLYVIKRYAVGVRSFHKMARAFLEERMKSVVGDIDIQLKSDTEALNELYNDILSKELKYM